MSNENNDSGNLAWFILMIIFFVGIGIYIGGSINQSTWEYNVKKGTLFYLESNGYRCEIKEKIK